MSVESLPIIKKVSNIVRFGIRNWLRAVLREPKFEFAHELSVVAIAKNEGAYFKEWIEFHLLVGVSKFYIYDNESNDDTRQVLQPYIDSGIVEYKYFPGEKMQIPAVNDAVKHYKYETKWMTHIDLDEFIVPVETQTVTEFLRKLPVNTRELIITWVMYGSDGHKTKPDGLVIENYMHRAEKLYGCKAIINPRFLYKMSNPHILNVAGNMVDENGSKCGFIDHSKNPLPCNKIRINHYHCKSWEEYLVKRKKGDVYFGKTHDNYNEKSFKKNDRNEVYDPIMKNFISAVKQKCLDDKCKVV